MAFLLFPGRHLLTTAFQGRYLRETLPLPVGQMPLVGAYPGNPDEKIERVIFAVTSANQENSRYNPVPFHFRVVGIDRFGQETLTPLGVPYDIMGVPHFNPSPRFAEVTLKEVAEAGEGRYRLSPENTVVLCSTPEVIALYRALGFAVLPAEHNPADGSRLAPAPIDCVRQLASAGEKWAADPYLAEHLSPATAALWRDFPQVPAKILRLWGDRLLNESGSLTDTRNYSTYALGMGNRAHLDAKYQDIRGAIVPGKIVDEGCADGALLTILSRDFPDSDLIGIELTREFMARCEERQRAGEFGGTFVHFHQRNLMEPIFEDGTIDTTICNSTTHEIWSYGDGRASLEGYLAKKFAQLRGGGHLVIRDVVGLDEKDAEVYLWLDDADGSNEDPLAKFETREVLATHIAGLSTRARFTRFAEDYLADARAAGRRGPETKIAYREEAVGERPFVVLRLKDAVEFLTKKDYPDNWQSELNEEFAFWSFAEWKEALRGAGFRVLENPNEPERSSRQFAIPWIVEHRYVGRAEIFKMAGGALVPQPYPPTNVILVAERPAA